MPRTLLAVAMALAGLIWSSPPAAAADLRVAVASNFVEPAREIAHRYEARTGHRVIISFGASGQLFAQITQAAPFDVFLSADEERPAGLEARGLAAQGSRFTYASGRLVLWSRQAGLVDPQGRILARGGFRKLAIADPKTAPYGLAALEVLGALGHRERLAPRLVSGTSITQTFQFVQTGAAELGFVALSQVKDIKGGSRWIVPARLHSPIRQQAVLLSRSAANPEARAFLAYLRGSEARAIIRRYGYEVP